MKILVSSESGAAILAVFLRGWKPASEPTTSGVRLVSKPNIPRGEPRRVLAEGRFARLVTQDGWEWIERVNTTGAVVIVPVTADGQLVLVEQYRIPLGCHVVELPAGLVGDCAGHAHEDYAEAARRELLEETGYEAPHLEYLTEGPSSAGLATEVYALFLARDARRVASGGGDGDEAIQVHVVPIDRLEAWLATKRRSGVIVDPKVYAGLYFALCGRDAARGER